MDKSGRSGNKDSKPYDLAKRDACDRAAEEIEYISLLMQKTARASRTKELLEQTTKQFAIYDTRLVRSAKHIERLADNIQKTDDAIGQLQMALAASVSDS